MPHLLDMPLLWLFGALSLGIFAGWLTYDLAAARWNERLAQVALGAVALGILLIVASLLPARYGDRLALGLVLAVVGAAGCYLLATSRWNDRPLDIGIGAAAIAILLAIAKVAPARYGHPLDLAVVLAIFGAIGGVVGWALRDLAESTPSTKPAAMTSAAAGGSYLFRDALAGIGASAPFMRGPTGQGGATQVRTVPLADALTKAPAPGGYTFPATLPFADATTNVPRSEPAAGRRRHWTWPAY